MSSCLLYTPHGWYYRRIVPESLRNYFGKREIKQSLQTNSKSIAMNRAAILNGQVSAAFEEARMADKPLFTGFTLKGVEVNNGVIKIDHLDMDPDKPEAEMALLNATTAHLTALTKPETGAAKPGMLISAAIKGFVDEKGTSGDWTPKTKDEVETALLLALEILGDQDMADITREDSLNVRKILQKLPTNRSKDPLYRGKSVAQILRMNKPATPLSETSVNKILTRCASMWHWAGQQQLVPTNPFTRMHLKKKVAARDLRKAFTTEQLKMLFGYEEYQKLSGAKKWAPLISLYSGLRLNEICQLDSTDVYLIDTIWVFDINQDAEDKHLKNLASKRLVPIHQHLIDLGFLKYATATLKARQKKLFPELKLQRDGYGQVVSKWFGRYRERAGVEERGCDFHSFRHTVATNLGNAGVPIPILEDILGHQGKSTTTSRYKKQYAETVMAPELEKLDYLEAIRPLIPAQNV